MHSQLHSLNGGNVDISRVYWANPAMIKAKKFIPITEYHDKVNQQVRQESVVTKSHSHGVPSAHTSQIPNVIERRPTTKAQVQPKQAGTNFKEYELFPKTNNKQYQLFPSNTANAHQKQHH